MACNTIKLNVTTCSMGIMAPFCVYFYLYNAACVVICIRVRVELRLCVYVKLNALAWHLNRESARLDIIMAARTEAAFIKFKRIYVGWRRKLSRANVSVFIVMR